MSWARNGSGHVNSNCSAVAGGTFGEATLRFAIPPGGSGILGFREERKVSKFHSRMRTNSGPVAQHSRRKRES